MNVVLLAAASSIHTIRWANGLNAAGHEVHVISQHAPCDPLDAGITLHQFPYRGAFGYFAIVPGVKKLLRDIKPDIVNAHYASGYATTARLAGQRPWLLSVWGSDVYDFPYTSPLHRWLVKKNLLSADGVASTSHCMAEQVRRLVPGLTKIPVTPFGVDMTAYESIEPVAAQVQQPLVIGTVKTMASKYGIDTLIEAFALLFKQMDEIKPDLAQSLQLRLVGGGVQTEEYKELSERLGIAEKVSFIGRVPHDQVPLELAELDVYVALSRLDSESFGVAIIEAGAAGRPVVVSDAGGLPEVTLQGKTGLVVPRENPQAAADAIQQLVLDPDLRHRFGVAGKQHVMETYSWPVCVQQMVSVFEQLIEKQIN